jgi:hypothetical protein
MCNESTIKSKQPGNHRGIIGAFVSVCGVAFSYPLSLLRSLGLIYSDWQVLVFSLLKRRRTTGFNEIRIIV